MNTNKEIADQVRNWARGMYTVEAGAELLIRSGFIYSGAPWVKPGASKDCMWIDGKALLTHAGMWSSQERMVASIAASLLGDNPAGIDLAQEIPTDRSMLHLVLAAIAHSAGSHESSDVEVVDGQFVFSPHESLYPWEPAAKPSPCES